MNLLYYEANEVVVTDRYCYAHLEIPSQLTSSSFVPPLSPGPFSKTWNILEPPLGVSGDIQHSLAATHAMFRVDLLEPSPILCFEPAHTLDNRGIRSEQT
jgi:hypothetical protein